MSKSVFKGLDLRQIVVIPFKPMGFEKTKKSLGFVQGLLFIFIFHFLLLAVNSVLDFFQSGEDFIFSFVTNSIIHAAPFIIFLVSIFLMTVIVTAISAVAKKKTNLGQTFGALSYSAIPAFYLGVISKLSYMLAGALAYSIDRYAITLLSILWFLYIGTYAVKTINKFGTRGSFLTILLAFLIALTIIYTILIIIGIIIFVLLMIPA